MYLEIYCILLTLTYGITILAALENCAPSSGFVYGDDDDESYIVLR
jgi:hypothetical protein